MRANTVVRQPLIIATLMITMVFSALAQTAAPPDFSGTWVLNPSKSTMGKDATVKSETLVIDNKKSSLVFHYKTDGKKSTETYAPDGQPRTTVVTSSSQLISKASWQDSVLVVESTLEIKVPNVVVSVSGLKPVIDKWTLAPDGRTLTHETEDLKEIRIYEKQ